MKHSRVFGFFDITRKNCQSNLVVVLVLKKVSITSHSTAFSIIYLYYCMCFAYHSVAELCIKKRYGQDNMDLDCQGEKQLSKRQLSVLKIKRGQKSIFQRICELVVEN